MDSTVIRIGTNVSQNETQHKGKGDTKDREDKLVKWVLLNQSFGIAVISRKKESRPAN